MARDVHAKVSPCERKVLLELDDKLDDLGFPQMGPREFCEDIRSRGGWPNVEQYLNAVKRDVWWHYDQVGDEDSRDLYEEAEALVYQAIRDIQACSR